MINEINAKRYCCEDISRIENYEKAVSDKEHMWECHHRLEIQGQFRNSVKLLKKCCMYWKQPAARLIFLRQDEHWAIHRLGENSASFGKHPSAETRMKMSQVKKGNKNAVGSKSKRGQKLSEETRRKISEAHKGMKHSEETRRKISEVMKRNRELKNNQQK